MTDSFEARFASININKSPRRKKVYPDCLYPEGASPKTSGENKSLSQRVLSSDRLTERKHPSLDPRRRPPNIPLPKTPTSNSHDNKRADLGAVSESARIPSYATPVKSQFSFMRETTSSVNKKQSPYITPSRSASAGSETVFATPTSSTKKRLEYSRQLSQSRSNRRSSGTSDKNTSNKEYTNKQYTSKQNTTHLTQNTADLKNDTTLQNTSPKGFTFKSRDQLLQEASRHINSPPENSYSYKSRKELPPEESPTKHKVRNLSQPLPLKSSTNVFDRLYPNDTAKKMSSTNSVPMNMNKNTIEERMRQQQKNHKLIQQRRNSRYLSNPKQSPKKDKPAPVQDKFVWPQQQQQQPKLMGPLIAEKSKPRYTESPRSVSSKVASLEELYEAVKPHLSTFTSDPDDVLASPFHHTNHKFNAYELGEVNRKKDLYFLPSSVTRNVEVQNYKTNFGFDDSQGNYKILLHDHINYRYEVIKQLGSGTFGNVTMVRDHKFKSCKFVALKIIKNDLNWSLQSINEIKILKVLNEDSPYILKYLEHFNFRSHMCIVTELLSVNLYTVIESTQFKGLDLDIVREVSVQIIRGLEFIHRHKIIHCDIKPENIMLDMNGPGDIQVKIIDFGSACFHDQILYTYIQSRYYRAPEVIFGAKFNEKIDIWSAGCVFVELFMGSPLASGRNEIDQVGLLTEIIGNPRPDTIQKLRNVLMQAARRKMTTKDNLSDNLASPRLTEKTATRTNLYKLFDQNGNIIASSLNRYRETPTKSKSFNSPSKNYLPGKRIEQRLGLRGNLTPQEGRFLEFVKHMICWDPSERLNATSLLAESFFTN